MGCSDNSRGFIDFKSVRDNKMKIKFDKEENYVCDVCDNKFISVYIL